MSPAPAMHPLLDGAPRLGAVLVPATAALALGLSAPSELLPDGLPVAASGAIALLLAVGGAHGHRGSVWVALAAGTATQLAWIPPSASPRVGSLAGLALWCSLAAASALLMTPAVLAARALKHRGLPFALTLPVLWLFLESARAALFVGADWPALGHAAMAAPLAQHACRVGGVRGASALVALTGALVADVHCLVSLAPNRRRLVAAVAAALLLVTPFHAPCPCPPVASVGPPLRIGVVQASGEVDGWREAAQRLIAGGATLVVGPEGLLEDSATSPVRGAAFISGAEEGCGWVGAHRCVRNVVRYFDAAGELRSTYDKRDLVPLFEQEVRGMAFTAAWTRPGRDPGIFDVYGVPVGVLTCFEVCSPASAADVRDAGARMVVHPTSDAWQAGSAAALQHVAIARARALELGLPILRVSNRRSTGWIDEHGRFHRLLADSPADSPVAAAAFAEIGE